MIINFDPAKDTANIKKHGLSLAAFEGFDMPPVVVIDSRVEYGEIRQLAFGRISGVGHCIVFTMKGDIMRMISFRRAHEKEMKRYE